MKQRLAVIFLLPFLAACTTVEFVRKDLTPQKKAVVRFSPPSSPEREKDYKEELAKKASEFCGGPFEITKEYQAREESGGTGVGTGVGFGAGAIFIGGASPSSTMYNFVELSCK